MPERQVAERRRILLVDDEASVRSVIRRALEAEGYEVFEASDAHQALALTADLERPVDLALLDVRLPSMDGPMLAHTLRRLRPGLRVLLISGYGDASQGEEIKEHLLGKPFKFDALAACVRDLIETGTCEACAPVALDQPRRRQAGNE
jgi:DNA-binding NtrC family response regulator